MAENLGGTLTIIVIEGKLLRDTEAVGKMDPLVEIKYLNQTQRTHTKQEGGKDPFWNQSFDF